MADKAWPGVPVTIDGERHKLKFTLGAFRRLKNECGIDLRSMSSENIDPMDIGPILWAGLLHEDRDLSLEEFEYKIDIRDLEAVSKPIGEAMGAAQADLEKAEAEARQYARGQGNGSGPLALEETEAEKIPATTTG